ncbi:MAG: response regulator [Anaerolineae bacterium]|nr:response regulator [Anaerolineae bacterium]
MGQKGKLLAIDDDRKLSEALSLYLTRAGYEVISAADGAEGLHKLYSEKPDLVLLDVVMPGMTECHFTKQTLTFQAASARGSASLKPLAQSTKPRWGWI